MQVLLVHRVVFVNLSVYLNCKYSLICCIFRLEASRRNARMERAGSSDDSDDDAVMVLATSATGSPGKAAGLVGSTNRTSNVASNNSLVNNSVSGLASEFIF